jgi:hypothetical protein
MSNTWFGGPNPAEGATSGSILTKSTQGWKIYLWPTCDTLLIMGGLEQFGSNVKVTNWCSALIGIFDIIYTFLAEHASHPPSKQSARQDPRSCKSQITLSLNFEVESSVTWSDVGYKVARCNSGLAWSAY